MPIGVPMRTAITVSMMLPMIGLSRPPAAPGGGVISVNTAGDRPLRPSNRQRPEDHDQPAEADHGGADRQNEDDAVAARRRL